MPKITNPRVLDVLRNPYFDHHAAMHLSREPLTMPDGTKEELFLPESAADGSHSKHKMIEVGLKGSGREFLEMHHEMIRVFRHLLKHHNPPVGWLGKSDATADPGWYSPALWDLKKPELLPHEIVAMFSATPDYLNDVFKGVEDRTRKVDGVDFKDAVDELGQFIERGQDLRTNTYQEHKGTGFHNTLHEYLAARERRAAQGAEMNKLRNSMYNDYFWSLHLWIDRQYERLFQSYGKAKEFITDGLDPDMMDPDQHVTHMGKGAEMPGMSMS
jgi:hypothetical protein